MVFKGAYKIMFILLLTFTALFLGCNKDSGSNAGSSASPGNSGQSGGS